MKEWRRLLQRHNYTMEDVTKAFRRKINQLKEKKTVKEKRPLGGHVKHKVGRFVTLRQSDYPIKMLVMQELYDKNEERSFVRIGYYIVSLKMLKRGKLSIVWGQFNPSISKKDLKRLINKAEKAGILWVT